MICLSPPINNEGGGRLFFFAGVSGVRWKSPVTPGKYLSIYDTVERLMMDDDSDDDEGCYLYDG